MCVCLCARVDYLWPVCCREVARSWRGGGKEVAEEVVEEVVPGHPNLRLWTLRRLKHIGLRTPLVSRCNTLPECFVVLPI